MNKLEEYLNRHPKGVRTFYYIAGVVTILLMLACISKTLCSSMPKQDITKMTMMFLAFIGVGVRFIHVGRDSYRKHVS